MLGDQTPAGLTVSTELADMDFETYSAAGYEWDDEAGRWRSPDGAPGTKRGLEVTGAAVYTEHPTFEILCLRYDLKDGTGSHLWRPGLPPPQRLFDHLAAGGLIEAWNAPFERWVWENHCTPALGWPPIRREQWRCAMAKARAHALPGKLSEAGWVLNTEVQKDARGQALLKKFSVPRNPTKGDPRLRNHPLWEPIEVTREINRRCATPPRRTLRLIENEVREDHADTLALDGYCATDIAAEAAISRRVPDLSAAELRYWQDDQAINKRGVQLDMAGVHDCIAVIRQAHARYGDEIRALTGGIAASEVQKLLGWLHSRGVHLDGLDEDQVAAGLRMLPPGPCDERRVLEIRAALASASVKKVFAMRNQATRAGRLHDMYSFHGARTGRPTGSGVQSTNLPKAGPAVVKCPSCGKWHGAHTMWCGWCMTFTLRAPKSAKEWNPDAMEDALRALTYRSLDFITMLFGDALLTIAGCLRGLFIAAPGKKLVSSDFTAIEGVVIACLAGEKWRIDAFAEGAPMYLLSAERMYGTTVAEMLEYAKVNGHHHPLRQKGKGGELGLGFGGWINALRQFDVDGPDDELQDIVLKWREASPALVHLWGGQFGGPGRDRWAPHLFGLEGAAIQAVTSPGAVFPVMRLDGTDSGIAYLMHGDVLYCRVPSGGLITYHRPRVQPAEQSWRGLALSFEGWNTNAKYGPPGWQRMGTYSGKLAENVTQKVARDIQMGAINRCERGGYPVVMHTYDEIVAEVTEGTVEALESLMTTLPPWAAGWPIKAAGGWCASRYRKG